MSPAGTIGETMPGLGPIDAGKIERQLADINAKLDTPGTRVSEGNL